MRRPPAVVIVARHGARLDAADTSWHLTSPTPYDPPLTYGGWTQSRALGARIASLLYIREETLESDEGVSKDGKPSDSDHFGPKDGSHSERQRPGSHRERRRRHKVIIHSSPFLRCIQTSIAIAAGMGQYHGGLYDAKTKLRAQSLTPNPGHPDWGPSTVPAFAGKSSRLPNIQEPERPTAPAPQEDDPQERFRKPTLRIDAFLGEWLSPDYFDLITPPPNSTMMVAGAKAHLLRRGEVAQTFSKSPKSVQGNFPGGWGGGSVSTSLDSTNKEDANTGPLNSTNDLRPVLPRRERSVTFTATTKTSSGPKPREDVKSNSGPYFPPQLGYAISPSDPIPRGHVAHARDACLVVDYQWDSMREPQNWPDGGEYGEEWSAMHRRFRKGLSQMVAWYQGYGSAGRREDALSYDAVTEQSRNDGREEEEEDLVIILVTHGAGCNALIGGLSNQPVLLDVGMASLTMATRKEPPAGAQDPNSPAAAPRRRLSVDLGLAHQYDMNLIASSEHLRAGVDPLRVPQLQSPKLVAQVPEYGKRLGIFAPLSSPSGRRTPGDVSPLPNESRSSANSALGSIRRSHTTTSYHRPSSIPTSVAASPALAGHTTTTTGAYFPNTGLWSHRTTISTLDQHSSGRSSPSRDMLPNFSNGTSATPTSTSNAGSAIAKKLDWLRDSDYMPERASTAHAQGPATRPNGAGPGLWGPPKERQVKDAEGEENGYRYGDASAGVSGDGKGKGDDRVWHAKGTRRRWTVDENEASAG